MEPLRILSLNAILKRLLTLGRSETQITSDQLRLPPALVFVIKRMLDAVEGWLKKHQILIRDPRRFIDEIAWYDMVLTGTNVRIDRLNTVFNILHRRRFELNASERFELSAAYCLKEEALSVWPELNQDQQQKYLAERMQQHDPIVIFWTGVCARQPWLSDSYLVRAFYWAAEHDYLEALEYFWEHIVQERADAVTFRAVRAFQLAACRGHLQTLVFLWRMTDEEQHRMMIQGTLTYTQGALFAFESACKDGQYDLVKFIFQEADYQQRVIILLTEECRAFRLAAEGGHLDVLRFFLEKSQRMKVKHRLLEAENCYAFRRAFANGHKPAVELIWTHADTEDDRRRLLNAILFSDDTKHTLGHNAPALGYLWKNCTALMRSAIFSNYIVPRMARKIYCSVYHTAAESAVKFMDVCTVAESTFFDVCEMEDMEEVCRYVEGKLSQEYADNIAIKLNSSE